jgi:hypothetical protein
LTSKYRNAIESFQSQTAKGDAAASGEEAKRAGRFTARVSDTAVLRRHSADPMPEKGGTT